MRRNDTMGIILTREDNIPPITDIRAIDALPIAGRYRIIDFIISCMANAGIQNIGIATTYNYFSLMEHLRVGEPWDLDRKNWGLRVLPPNVEKKGMSKPKGTVDVLDGIRDYISSSTQTYVVLSFGSGIYNIDLSEAVEDHINKQADVTMIYKDKSNDEITENDLSRFTLLEMDENEKITDIAIEPFYPNSSIVFMEMLIMEKALLESIIDECTSRGETDFMKDAIVKRISSLRIFGHKYEGAAKKIDSMKSYFDAGMSFLCDDFRKAIFNNERPIQTRSTAQSPTSYGGDAVTQNCFISDGGKIDGEVYDSILSRRVVVGKGAVVKNSIIMQDCIIEDGAQVTNVVLDKDVRVTKGRKLIGAKSYPLAVERGTVI